VFHATSLVLDPLAQAPGTLTGSCGDSPGIACRLAWGLTHNPHTAEFVRAYLASPVTRGVRIAFVIALAVFVRFIAHRVINRITERAATSTLPAAANGRAQGANLTPLLLSTTVLGVALGFGAQNMVRDYLSGILTLTEDHYGVGDTINVKDVSGTVEAMTLLTTRLRDVNGVVWHVRNGTIDTVGNESQGWSRAIIDYPVPYGEDLAHMRLLMQQAADSLYRERGWCELMLEEPEVWGAQELSSREVTMRVVVKTAPMRQWEVARELRARVKAALDAAGVAPAGPDTIVITAPPGDGSAAGPDPAAGQASPAGVEPAPGADTPPDAGRSAGTAGALEDEAAGSPS